MAGILDHSVVRNSTHAELAKYLRSALERNAPGQISSELLAAAAVESISPRVFHVWLSVCHDPTVLVEALKQEHSVRIRKVAIKQLGKSLRCSPFHATWSALNGIEGILAFLSRASVNEVAFFCRILGNTGTSQATRQERQKLVTELLKALVPDYFPDAKYKTTDRRPLLHRYCEILPACTSEMVAAWIKNKDLPRPRFVKLLMAHPGVMHQCCSEAMLGNEEYRQDASSYFPLLQEVPSEPTSEKGMSRTMAFSIELLHSLNANTKSAFWAFRFQNELAVPLLRRMWRRRCRSDRCHEVVSAVLQYLRKFLEAPGSLYFRRGFIFDYVVRLWSRRPHRFESTLVDLLGLVSEHESKDFDVVTDLIRSVSQNLRIQLLGILLQNLRHFKINWTNDEDLANCKVAWPARLLLSLPTDDALSLLERLVRLRPEGDFLKTDTWNQNIPFSADVLRLYLIRARSESVDEARTVIEQHKKRAVTSREQTDRASWGRSAIFCAIASGSLQLYEETLLWARRFNKDPLTIKELYSSKVLHATENLDLLCGLPDRLDDAGLSIEESVKAANRICKLLLDTAYMAIREPSFHEPDWAAVKSLFAKVVQKRLAHVTFQQELALSDDEVYRCVWRDTINTCLVLERLGHQEGHLAVGFDKVGGPVQAYGVELTIHRPRDSTLRFLDELAKERNELWEQLRKSAYPSVLTLSPPWPRGLPVQWLLSAKTDGMEEGYDLPYLLSRAEHIVFVDPDVVLVAPPNEQELKNTIGPFVEDWAAALQLWINAAPKESRTQRAQQAWRHAFDNLTGSRISTSESYGFWRKEFADASIDTAFIQYNFPVKPDPAIPQVDDPTQPTEWNPDPERGNYTISSRALDSTALDCMLNAAARGPSSGMHWQFKADVSYTDCSGERSWRDIANSRPSPAVQEALVAAAILYLNGKTCSRWRLLGDPFPNAQDARYPALFLDDQFLERKDLYAYHAVEILEALGETVPPTLLAQLARAMFQSLRNQEDPHGALEHNTFQVLKILAAGDKPDAALELIGELILDRPEDSSWHRYLLTRKLFASLSVSQARKFLSGLASEIQSRLEQQVQATSGTDESGPSAAKAKPAVKVTTIKMLAEMMSNVEFVDQDFAVDILTGLLVRARHLDIRVTVVQSLLKMLGQTRDSALKAKIFQTLKQHVVLIAGALNERQVMTEEEWQKAASEAELPEIYMGGIEYQIAPVMRALLDASNGSTLEAADKQELVTTILVPAVLTSAENNQRWTDLFLRKHKFTLQTAELPPMPTKQNALITLLKQHTQWMPASLFKMHNGWVMANLDSLSSLHQVNEAVMKDVTLRSTNAGLHFLTLWYRRFNALHYGGLQLSDLLLEPWSTEVPDGFGYVDVQECLMRQADALLHIHDAGFRGWNLFQKSLEPRTRLNEHVQRCWYEYCRPVVEKVVKRVESLRTPEWQRDLNRTPTVLPDVFPMWLWLLPYPSMPWVPEHGERRQAFAREVSGIITTLAGSGRPYHDKFKQLETAVLRIFESDYAFVAAELGSLEMGTADLSLADLLRVELAENLLLKANDPKDGECNASTRAMISDWRASADEDVRMRGIRLTRLLEDVKNDKFKWLRE